MSPLLIIIAGFIGVTALIGGVAVMFMGRSDEKLEDRLTQFTTNKRSVDVQGSVLKHGALEAFQAGGGIVQSIMKKLGRFHLLFEQAGTRMTPEKFFIFSAGLGLGVPSRVFPPDFIPDWHRFADSREPSCRCSG